jgi:hypothetical protein
MEAVAIIVSVVPLLAVMALLARLLRRRLRPLRETPPGRFPGRPGGPNQSGDRSPTRPRGPMLSGGMAIPEPHDTPWDHEDDAVARVQSSG